MPLGCTTASVETPLDGGTMTPNSDHDGAYFHFQQVPRYELKLAYWTRNPGRNNLPRLPPMLSSPVASVSINSGVCGRSLLLPDEKKSRIAGSYARHWQHGIRVPGDGYTYVAVLCGCPCNARTHPVGTNCTILTRNVGPRRRGSRRIPTCPCALGKEVEFHV